MSHSICHFIVLAHCHATAGVRGTIPALYMSLKLFHHELFVAFYCSVLVDYAPFEGWFPWLGSRGGTMKCMNCLQKSCVHTL